MTTLRPARRATSGGIALGLVTLLSSAGPLQATYAQAAPRGKAVYDKWCAECHGVNGAGDGSAATYMLPRPRDFTKAVYQIRTTGSGELPTDADIRHVIDEGMPGTAMPGWATLLNREQRDDLVAYLKSFSQFFSGAAPAAIAIGEAPGSSDETIADGRTAYATLECAKCHGEQGRGDGQSAPTLTDDLDRPIRAADLGASWNFNGGSSVEDIYTRLRTGLDGTPMPSFSDAVDAKVVTDEQLWHVAQYVRSLSPEDPPEVREVVRAALTSGALPASPDDSAWNAVERFWVPLVGQIIIKPRWFSPTVNGIWVQALHNGQALTLRLSWHDPSRSPDPAWDEWLGRMSASMTAADGPNATRQGSDRIVVQFPERIDAAEPPYFLGGDSRRPVYVWRWTSDSATVREARGTGLGQFTTRPSSALTHAAMFDHGEWRLQITRALVPPDTTAAPVFATGRAIPIAFFAADGSNGEDGVRGSVSAWYAIYLDVPTPQRVYIAPAAAMLLTAGLGLLMVRQAQRRERSSRRSTTEVTS
ncbi:MAG: c-type cytochrome [Gemmatimonadaceae bacterium]